MLLIMLSSTAFMAATGPGDVPDLAALLPAEIHGWRAAGPDGLYTADTLYTYINGGAEVYRSFNVQRVLGRRYVKAGGPEIIADVFDMGSSKDAFGAYHHDMREGVEAGLGQDSEYQGGALSFWKDRFFVSLLTLEETEDTRRALTDLGKTIDAAIPGKGALPDLVNLLPEEGLIRKQVHYFHDYPCLSRQYSLTEKNVLSLSPQAEGILARYRSQSARGEQTPEPCALLLVRYPSADEAKRAYEGFLAAYLPNADADGAAQRQTGKWAGAHLEKDLVIGVLDAPSKSEVQRMTGEVLRRIDPGGAAK